MRKQSAPEIAEQAAEWYQEYHSSDRFDMKAFTEWLERDPRHRSAYEEIVDQNNLIAAMRDSPGLSTLRSEALAYADKRRDRRAREFRVSRRGLIAASVGLVGVVGAGYYVRGNRHVVQTGLGEQRLVTLPDSSKMYVDANSEMEFAFSRKLRGIKLLSGRAHFEVAKDPSRPFTVTALDKSVAALGTAFTVEARNQKIYVTLEEGKIAVAQNQATAQSTLISDQVQPGQQMVLAYGDAQPRRLSAVDLALATGWREGKIVFDDETLADAASRMNDYSTSKIVIEGEALQNQRVTGLFVAGRSETFVNAVEKYYRVHVSHSNGRYVIRSAA